MGSSRKSKSTRAKRARPEDRTVTPDWRARAARNDSAPPDPRLGDNSPERAGRGSSVSVVESQESVHLRKRLRLYLLTELAALERAQSVVHCLAVAMQDGASWPQGPYYPDVAHSASDLMTQMIGRLSDLLLDGRLPDPTRSEDLR